MPRGQKREADDGPSVSLSGYQPNRQQSGLYLTGPGLYEEFLKAMANGDRTGEGLRVVVVGVLEAVSAHIPRPGIEKDPSVELRFVKIEPVINRDSIDGDPREVVVNLIQQLQDIRRGESPSLFDPENTDSPGDGDESLPAQSTSRPRRGRAAKLAAVPPPEATVE